MKKQLATFLITITFLFFGVFISANQVHAETEVSGNILADTTWTLVNSPYVVTESVQIFEGVKLIIEPGVIVTFNENKFIRVGGQLIAIGEENKKITFTSSQSNKLWTGISFTTTSVSAIVDNDDNYLSGSIIKNSIIEFCNGNWSGGGVISFSSSTPYLSSNEIRNNTGVAISGGSKNPLVVIDNYIHDNKNIIQGGKINLKNNIIKNNGAGGIILGGESEIIGNVIEDNDNMGPIISLYSSKNAIVKNNSIVNNSRTSHTSIIGLADNGSRVEDNNIHNKGVRYEIEYSGRGDVVLKNNYWGTTTASEIDKKIFDYYDDINYGKVIYEPFAPNKFKIEGNNKFVVKAMVNNDTNTENFIKDKNNQIKQIQEEINENQKKLDSLQLVIPNTKETAKETPQVNNVSPKTLKPTTSNPQQTQKSVSSIVSKKQEPKVTENKKSELSSISEQNKKQTKISLPKRFMFWLTNLF